MKWITGLCLIGCCFGGTLARAGDADSLRVPAPSIGASPWILGGALAALSTEQLAIHPRKQTIPPEGLDLGDIRLGLDRRGIHPYDSGTSSTSTWLEWATILVPNVEREILGEDTRTWFNSLGVQLEANLLATAVTSLMKSAVSRPRPYAYRNGFDGSDLGSDWAASDQTFRSFPSGHTTSAWASAMSHVSLTAMNHPDRSAATHFVSGLIGGGLATSTSLMRVEAGTHFPTDVAAGSLIGGGIGYILPVFHSRNPVPGVAKARKWGLLGTAAGIALGFLVTPPTSPLVH